MISFNGIRIHCVFVDWFKLLLAVLFKYYFELPNLFAFVSALSKEWCEKACRRANMSLGIRWSCKMTDRYCLVTEQSECCVAWHNIGRNIFGKDGVEQLYKCLLRAFTAISAGNSGYLSLIHIIYHYLSCFRGSCWSVIPAQARQVPSCVPLLWAGAQRGRYRFMWALAIRNT